MNDKARLFDLGNQPPVIQLFATFSIVIIAGTLFFYLFVLAGSFFFGTGTTEMLSLAAESAGQKKESILKYIQASQQIAMFIIPSAIIASLLRTGNKSFLRTDRIPGSIPVSLVIVLALVIIPVTNYTGMLNSKMNLPGWLSGLEAWMRTKENYASELTGLLMKSTGIGALIINVIVLAIIPSIAEEMIFRGILQQILCRIFRPYHIGIWITAFLFSAVHFQFFGFFPRLILGLSFGYLFYWSGNLWLAVIAHFINNAVLVVISHFMGWNELGNKASGLAEKQILFPLIPALMSVGILYYFWSEHRNNLVENI
jgi:uncharacterized protein